MGFGRGKGQEGRGERGGAHQGLDLGGDGPEVGVQRRGRASGVDDNGGWRRQPDSGRMGARPSSWRGGVGSGQGCTALGARNRSGVARGGRRRARRWLELVSARREREEKEKGRTDWRLPGQRERKSGVGARWPTRGSSPPATVAGMASGRHSAEHWRSSVHSFDDFDSNLTLQNSNFDIGT